MNGMPPRRLNAQIAQEAAEWFVANREDVLSPEQARAFLAWLRTSPQHVAEYLELAAIAEYAPGAARRDPASVEDLLARTLGDNNVVELEAVDPVSASPRIPTATPRVLVSRSRHWAFPWGAGLAAILSLAAVGGALFWSLGDVEVRNYATAHGQQGAWILPDGTRLHLNSESAASVRFDRHKREVEVVHGQALFDIAAEPARPFEVRTGSYMIEDVGTVFDVHRRAGEITVTVVDGRVQVFDASRSSAVAKPSPLLDLGAGQQARISATGAIATLDRVDTGKEVAWTRAEIVFEDEPLSGVVAEFNRYGSVQMRIGEPGIGEVRVSGTFGIHDEATFRAFLDTLPGLRVETTADGVVVRRRDASLTPGTPDSERAARPRQ